MRRPPARRRIDGRRGGYSTHYLFGALQPARPRADSHALEQREISSGVDAAEGVTVGAWHQTLRLKTPQLAWRYFKLCANFADVETLLFHALVHYGGHIEARI